MTTVTNLGVNGVNDFKANGNGKIGYILTFSKIEAQAFCGCCAKKAKPKLVVCP